MKKILLVLIVMTLVGCRNYRDSKKLIVRVTNDGGWQANLVECDSANMLSPNRVVVWIDGNRMEMYGKDIQILSSRLYH